MFIRQNFRLYPNKAQSKQILQWVGQARYVWNKMLEKNIEEYDTNKKIHFCLFNEQAPHRVEKRRR